MLKLVRLLRLGRMVTYLRMNKKYKFGMKLIQLLFMLLLIIHWMNCVWYYVTKQDKVWIPPFNLTENEYNFWDFVQEHGKQYIMFFYYCVLTL
jgi:hypothetical protein